MGFSHGANRHEALRFPERLDDAMPAEHPGRFLDAFVAPSTSPRSACSAPRPRGRGWGPQRCKGRKHEVPASRKGPPVLRRNNGGPPRGTRCRNSQGAYQPRAVHPITGQPRGMAGRRRPSRRQACLVWAGSPQAPGRAQPRSTPLPAKTPNRVPSAVASRASASGVPCHQRTPQASKTGQHVSPCKAWRFGPRWRGPWEDHARAVQVTRSPSQVTRRAFLLGPPRRAHAWRIAASRFPRHTAMPTRAGHTNPCRTAPHGPTEVQPPPGTRLCPWGGHLHGCLQGGQVAMIPGRAPRY
jgi:hypothetical protein